MATVLLTGGAGYIGSHTALAFREAGHAVVVLDNLSTGVRSNVPPDVPLVEADVGDEAAVAAALREHRPDAVLHFAGSIVVPESVADPIKYYVNNTLGSLRLIAACVRLGVPRFIFSSTAAVYGLVGERPVRESDPASPINPYGWSKLMVEQMLADIAAAEGLQYAVLRYFNVAGADPEGRVAQQRGAETTHLVRVACEAACGRRRALCIFGDDYETRDGTCIRDFIHVSDLADAHLAVYEHLCRTPGSPTFNCGNGRGFSVREVVAALEAVTGRALPVEAGPRRPGDPPMVVADPSHLMAQVGWRPRFGIEDIMGTALEAERRQSPTLARTR